MVRPVYSDYYSVCTYMPVNMILAKRKKVILLDSITIHSDRILYTTVTQYQMILLHSICILSDSINILSKHSTSTRNLVFLGL